MECRSRVRLHPNWTPSPEQTLSPVVGRRLLENVKCCVHCHQPERWPLGWNRACRRSLHQVPQTPVTGHLSKLEQNATFQEKIQNLCKNGNYCRWNDLIHHPNKQLILLSLALKGWLLMLHWQGLAAPVMTVSIGSGTSTCLVLHTSLKKIGWSTWGGLDHHQHRGNSELKMGFQEIILFT